MGVNKKVLVYLLFFFGLQTLSADTLEQNDNVNIFVEQKLKQTLKQWGEQVKICQEKEEKNPLSFEPSELEDLNISIDTFKTAVMTLNYNNFSLCTKKKRDAYISQSLLVYKIQQEKGKEGTDVLNFVLTTLPSNDVLEAFVKYENLSPTVRSYFEKHIGLEPFNIVTVSMPILKHFRE
ncbi:MAG: hypothetical protein L3J43_03875 [Sulfurovum sp.]|nr:hypothetical protein [Sulfurovum sp.]